MKNSIGYAQATVEYRQKCLEIAKGNYKKVFKETRRGDTRRKIALGFLMEFEQELSLANIRLEAIQARMRIIGR